MCGIAGVVAWDNRFRIGRETLERMSEQIAHRGPDGQRIWINQVNQSAADQPQAGLVFSRLAILDLDPRAMQPITDGKRWLVFNGEIYNFRELRAELDRLLPAYTWKTAGDSEVILRAYEQWGDRCVQHFDGMFALAIWTPADATLFLARDRMGQKPLYYAVAPEGGAVAFASELAALRPVGWIPRDIDAGNVVEYLRRGYVPHGSIYRHIKSLAPGHTATFPHSGLQQKYFDPNAITNRPTQSARQLVRQAVTRQMVADVPVGCFLSGGIDSSIVAAAMKSAAPKNQPVLTFSIGFDDPRYDETAWAAAVARHLGTQHRQFIVRPDAANDLPKLARVFGEPFGDSSALPTHYLSRQCRDFVKVALSGDGGDELFGGYDRYRAVALAARLDQHPAIAAILKHRSWRFLPGVHPKSRSARAKRFSASLALPPGKKYAQYLAIFDDAMIDNLLGENLRLTARTAAGSDLADQYSEFLLTRDTTQAALALDRVSYLPGDLLTKVDRASMLHALEVRSPFLDPDLLEFAAGLSTEQLLRGGAKRLLREAFSDELPKFVFRRKKMGFAVPIGEWLRTSLKSMLHDLLLASHSFATANLNVPFIRQMIEDHESCRVDHSQRLYALLMLELWHAQG